MKRLLCALLLCAPLKAEPGVTLLLDGRQPAHRQLSAQAKRYLLLLRRANQLEDYQLSIATADWSDPGVAAQWQSQFAVTPKELPALAVVQRQGNRFTVSNLLRRYPSPQAAAEGAFRCLQTSAPNLIRETVLHTGLALTSQPSGASLLVDGKASGTTPCQVPLPPGRHKIELVKPNCQPYLKEISLELGQTYSQDAILEPIGAYLRVESAGVPVQFVLDGAPPAPTPYMADVAAGTHHYTASAPGFYSAEGDLEVAPERLTSVNIALVPIRLRVSLANFQASGYTGYNTRSSGTGWRRTEWSEPYEVVLDPGQLQQQLHQGLSQSGRFDLVNSEPDCSISVEIRSSKDQVLGTAVLVDGQGRVAQTLNVARDMPLLTFDEQGSAQLRSGEVIGDLLELILPMLPQFQPQSDKTPPDRQAQVKVEVGPNP